MDLFSLKLQLKKRATQTKEGMKERWERNKEKKKSRELLK
jgi:hypothetical protein